MTCHIPKHLSVPSDPSTNIFSFYNFPNVYPIIFIVTLIISAVALLVNNTFHLQLYKVHSVLVVRTLLHEMLHIHPNSLYLAITNDKQYYTCPAIMDIRNV